MEEYLMQEELERLLKENEELKVRLSELTQAKQELEARTSVQDRLRKPKPLKLNWSRNSTPKKRWLDSVDDMYLGEIFSSAWDWSSPSPYDLPLPLPEVEEFKEEHISDPENRNRLEEACKEFEAYGYGKGMVFHLWLMYQKEVKADNCKARWDWWEYWK